MNAPLQLNALIKRAGVGDEKAQETLFRQYYSFAFEIARRYGRKDFSAERICQESFEELFQRIKDFDPSSGSFKTYFKNIIVLKGTQRHSITYIPTILPSLREWPALKPAEVEPTLQQLPAGVHIILVLAAVEGYNNGEIAERLKIRGEKGLGELKLLTAAISGYQPIVAEKISTLPSIETDPEAAWEAFRQWEALAVGEGNGLRESVEDPAIQSVSSAEMLADRQWSGWAFLLFLIAASLLMIYWAGIYNGEKIEVKKPGKGYREVNK